MPHLFEIPSQAKREDGKPAAQKKPPARYTAHEKRTKKMAEPTDFMSLMLMETGGDLADIRVGLERMKIHVKASFSSKLRNISGHPVRVASPLNIYDLETLAHAADAFVAINRFVRSLENDRLFESDPHLRAGFNELHACVDEVRSSILGVCEAEGGAFRSGRKSQNP
ncbi:MAG: hypothetical protein IJS32_07030 [Kiritimatiellae bacterium]|nr:hypothetical protein [Kiritimatiellia bacterium]